MDRKRVEEFAGHYFRPWFVRVLVWGTLVTGALIGLETACSVFLDCGCLFPLRQHVSPSVWPWILVLVFAGVSVAVCENKIHALQVTRARYGAKVRGLRKMIGELEAELTRERLRYRECVASHGYLYEMIKNLRARAGLTHVTPTPPPASRPASSDPASPQEPAPE